ncbi:glutamate racemase [Psychroflexus sp. ALD_RP9]|uniref:glutamate racemase n=1 Tax=Psychroflexus sp. ALD_RP9 TaxID=2777186 RepID=UPI001A8F6A35|nr:glutamate racemase [Psychroflexus sp. ALD_RP9]QSS96223.1 glutamate racemase [Psychroflexus sp. ALD_RP9]
MFTFQYLKVNKFSKQPIGVFDSGVGGTSILKELVKMLPQEDFIYLSDSINAPYGEKTKAEIIKLSHKNTQLLIEKFNAKLVVVACNTATTNAIEDLRKSYAVPFIGIEPAIKPAALQSRTKYIGVLATKGTLSSELFEKTSKTLKNEINLIEVEGKHIVEAVENGETSSESFKTRLKRQVKLFKNSQIDYLVLGCTHYPYIKPILENLLPKVKIIDSGFAVAKQTKKILESSGLVSFNSIQQNIDIYTNKPNQNVIKNLFKNEEVRVNINFFEF